MKTLKILKKDFKNNFEDIDPSEIASIEQELIESGELSADQITKLCNLHVEIFKESLKDKIKPESLPAHPINTYMEENKMALELIQQLKKKFDPLLLIKLSQIQIHYTILENQLFPALEKVGFTGPSQVMWAKHDEIRDLLKKQDLKIIDELLTEIKELVFKEENILFPTALKKLSEEHWIEVKKGEEEIGLAWITPENLWYPITPNSIHVSSEKQNLTLNGENINQNIFLDMNTGRLTLEQLNLMLTNLPVEISFIDKNDEVMYYSNHQERIFPRSPGVIGRNVKNCHPPKSQHIVLKILAAFRKKEKTKAEFWITLQDKLLYIRYFAIRNAMGEYEGTLEVTQDITSIQKIKGTKRLLNWE